MYLLKNNKGGGIAVIVYGVTLMLLFIFTAINILNAKIIELGYNSLRDTVQSASAGSVIHLLKSQSSLESQQSSIASSTSVKYAENYDLYLQLALGYIVNRKTSGSSNSMTIASGTINNFLKLDHKKVINSTLALLNDSVIRNKDYEISNTQKYKIFMIFIEPEYNNDDFRKTFNLIVYGNNETDQKEGISIPVEYSGDDMSEMYNRIEKTINNMVNGTNTAVNNHMTGDYAVKKSGNEKTFEITLTSGGKSSKDKLIREMETVPYYLIIVKDFALPTLFEDKDTNTDEGIFKSAFKDLYTNLSGDGHLKTPMCALNAGKTERRVNGTRR